MIIILIALFFFLAFLGLPIAFSLGFSSLIYIIIRGYPLELIIQRMFSITQSFPLLAIPFFILLGQLVVHGGLIKRLLKISNLLVGRFRGSLALISIVASFIFAGMSGSSVADAAGIGSVLIPAMKEEGYDDGFNTAINATSSTLGVIIPPSIDMVIVGWIAGISVGKLFLGGVIPGILIASTMFIYTIYISKKRNYPRSAEFDKLTISQVIPVLKDSIWGLIIPIIIIASILSGFATPTEVSVIAVAYTLFISTFIYKELTLDGFIKSIKETIITTAVVMAVVTTANVFSWLMMYENLPEIICNKLISMSANPIIILLLIDVMLLIAGMFIDMVPGLLLFGPFLFPVITQLGIDPIHFGVVIVVALAIGLYTPPVGTTLFVSCKIAKVPIDRVLKDLIPFFIMGSLIVFLISLFPKLVTWFPYLVFK